MRKYRTHIRFMAAVLVLTCALVHPQTAFAWGDNSPGGEMRESHTRAEIESGVLGDSIVFNTISDSVIGDEKNFVAAREYTGINAGAANEWSANEIDVEDGKEYLIRLYVHNNSPLGLDAVSENTRVAFSIPMESGKQIEVNGFIFSDNAVPSEYWDYVRLNSSHDFHLEYVYGSAFIENNGFASQANGGAKQLSDEIVTAAASKHGVAIGYDALDGRVPGCYQYACYVGIQVRVVYDYEFSVETGVCRADQHVWKDEVTAAPGDQLEFFINYINTSEELQTAVTLENTLPGELTFLDGTIVRADADSRNIGRDDLNGSEIPLGDFAPGERVSIAFRAEVASGEERGAAVNWVSLRVGSTRQEEHMSVDISISKPIPAFGFGIVLFVWNALILLCLILLILSGHYLWQNREADKDYGRHPKKK